MMRGLPTVRQWWTHCAACFRRVRLRWRATRTLPVATARPSVVGRALVARAAACEDCSEDAAVEALCNAALAQYPGHAGAMAGAAAWLLATGRPELAALACEHSFGHNAANSAQHRALQATWGEALLVLDRASEAAWRFEAACALDGATPTDWARLAGAYCRAGRYDEAIEAGRKAVVRPWAWPEAADDAAVTMAQAHYCLGQTAKAEEILERVLARAPRQREAQRLLTKVRDFLGKGVQHDA